MRRTKTVNHKRNEFSPAEQETNRKTSRAARFNKDITETRNQQNDKKPPQKVVFLPKNIAQEKYIGLLEDPNVNIVFATGPAGTGKSLLATVCAIKQLQQGLIDRIVITRPAVSVDEQHGFLPGTLVEKMAPWVLPIIDVFHKFYNKKQVLTMIEDGTIDIAPLAYMRGRTFDNCFIIGDEIQNCTISQCMMLLTRIGFGSKIVITGDMAQHDRGFENNGLADFMKRLARNTDNRIASVQFTAKDVERHPIIGTILRLYED